MYVIIIRDLLTRDEYENPEVYTTFDDAQEDMLALRKLWEQSYFYPDRVEQR